MQPNLAELTNNIKYPVLYKMDSTGNIRYWFGKVDLVADGARLEVYHGVLTNFKPYCQEAAYFESDAHGDHLYKAELEWKRKFNLMFDRKGYTKEIPEAKPDRCMLAHVYDDHRDFFHDGEECFIQPKLDGMRCIAVDGKLYAREGAPIPFFPHIKPPPGKWDGELYVHDWEFEQIMSVCKVNYVHPMSKHVKFHVFDQVTEDPFWQRNLAVEAEFGSGHHENIVAVQTFKLHYSHDTVLKLMNEFIGLGYEGVMIRTSDGPYEIAKRSKHLQKVKPWYDDWFPIVNIVEGKGKAKGTAVAVCMHPTGQTFEVNLAFTTSRKRTIWLNRQKYIGKSKVHVRYRGLTTNKLPKHASGVDLCLLQSVPMEQNTTGKETENEDAKTETFTT